VHHEGAVAGDVAFRRTEHVNVRQLDVRAFETPRHHSGEEAQLAHVLAHDDIEEPIIEQRVWRGTHAPTVGTGVRDPHRVTAELETLAGRAQLELEASGTPRRQRAESPVQVYESAQPGGCFVGDSV